jgi:hypothetical protein
MARPLLYPVRLNVRISKETEAALRRIEQRLGTNTSEAIRASIEHLEKWAREQKKRKG